MRKIRWGVMGAANIGRAAVIPAIQASSNGELVAVASRDAVRAADFAAKLAIPRSYGSYAELLAADDIDAVYIPLPNSLHREWTLRAAVAGKHILCEKPLGLSAAECLEMAAAAEDHGVLLMEAFMYRFHPRTEQVLAMVRDGAVGEVRFIHAAFTFCVRDPANIRLQPELGGGALMDVGCYCVNLARTVAGAEPMEVQAYARWHPGGVDEQIVGTLRFADGLLAQFDCALSLERREEYQIAGVDGYLHVPGAFVLGAQETVIVEHRGRTAETHHPVEGANEYQRMVEHFADCLLTGQPVRYSAFEAAANLRTIEAIYRSARADGRPMPVDA